MGAVHVVDTRKTRIKAGYAAKTDRLDARRLADALRRDSIVGIYYPPPAIRDLRELGRYRCHLARLQASLKQRIHALLLRQGVAAPRGLFTQRGHAVARRRWPLEGWAGDELRGLRQVLADVRAQLVPVLTAIRTVAAADPIARALDQPARVWARVQRHAARRDRHHRPVPRWAAFGQLRRAGAARRAQWQPAVERPDHQNRLAVVAVDVDRGGDSSISSSRRLGALGAQLGRQEGHVEGARRRRAGAVRGDLGGVAAPVNLSRVDGRRRHGRSGGRFVIDRRRGPN